MVNKLKKYSIFRAIHKYFFNILFSATSLIRLKKILVPKNKMFRSLYFFLLDENLTFKLDVNGVNFYIKTSDKVNSRKIFSSLKFPQFDQLIKAHEILISQNMITEQLVDIGSHHGNISIPAISKSLFNRAIAVEPVYESYEILNKNILLNKLDNDIKPLNLFLGTEETVTEMYTFKNNTAASFNSDDTDYFDKYTKTFNLKNTKKVTVEQTTLDNILNNDLDKTFIWSYCQGDDIKIINSSLKVKKFKIPFSIPVSYYLLKKNKINTEFFVDNLIQSNYQYLFDLNEVSKVYSLNLSDFNKICKLYGTSGGFTNVLFL
jgi:FkbM family methyltransferase